MSAGHHPLGSSTLARRAACPGSYAAEIPFADLPDEETDDTRAGNARHAAARAGLEDQSRRLALLADLPTDDRPIVEAWWRYWDGKVTDAAKILAAGAETRVALSGDRFGTCDGWMLWRDHQGRTVLTVADLKGQPPGRARYNLQAADYAAGLCDAHKIGHGARVELAIISRAGIDEHAFDPDEFTGRVREIESVITAAKADNAERRPGDHCGHCRAADTCDARRAVAARTAGLLACLSDPVGFLSSLAPDQRTATLDSLMLATDRLSEAVDAIKAKIRDGALDVPCYRLTQTTRQDWRNATESRVSILMLAQSKGIDAEEVTPLISASKASQIFGKQSVEALTERKPGTPSVRRSKGAA